MTCVGSTASILSASDFSRGFKVGIGRLGHNRHAEVQRLEFSGGQVQWWQGDLLAHHIADAAFALDRDTRGDQRVHIAIDRADRHLEPVRDVLRAVQFAVAQDLNDIEQAIRAAHVTPSGPRLSGHVP